MIFYRFFLLLLLIPVQGIQGSPDRTSDCEAMVDPSNPVVDPDEQAFRSMMMKAKRLSSSNIFWELYFASLVADSRGLQASLSSSFNFSNYFREFVDSPSVFFDPQSVEVPQQFLRTVEKNITFDELKVHFSPKQALKSLVDLLILRDMVSHTVARLLGKGLVPRPTPNDKIRSALSVAKRYPVLVQALMVLDFVIAARSTGVSLPLPAIDSSLLKKPMLQSPFPFFTEMKNLFFAPRMDPDYLGKRFDPSFYDSLTRKFFELFQKQDMLSHFPSELHEEDRFRIQIGVDIAFSNHRLVGAQVKAIEEFLALDFDLTAEIIQERFELHFYARHHFLAALLKPDHIEQIRAGPIHQFLLKFEGFDSKLAEIESIEELPRYWDRLKIFAQGEPIPLDPLDSKERKMLEVLSSIQPVRSVWLADAFTYAQPQDLATYLKTLTHYEQIKLVRHELTALLRQPMNQLDPNPIVRRLAAPLVSLRDGSLEKWDDNPFIKNLRLDRTKLQQKLESLAIGGRYVEYSLKDLLGPYML